MFQGSVSPIQLTEANRTTWTEIARQEALDPDARFSLAVKANISVAGFQTHAGSPGLAGVPAVEDAPVVAALRKTGAFVVGATNMHELAAGITSENGHFGAVELPGHPGFSAGGSSGGSAAAVAAGEVDLALGTDTGGSVSIPASHCGVYGYRPSTGRWPGHGIVGLSWTRDTPGVIAPSFAHLDFAEQAITQQKPEASGDGRVSIGVPQQFVEALDDHTRSAFREAVERLPGTQYQLAEFDYSSVTEPLEEVALAIVLYEGRREIGRAAAAVHQVSPEEGFRRVAQQIASPDVKAMMEYELEQPVSADAYEQAVGEVWRVRAVNAELMEAHDYDALLFPTTPAPPPRIGAGPLVPFGGGEEDLFTLMTRNSGAGTLTGSPMVTVPGPVPAGELPVGFTIQGRRFDDQRTMSIARRIDEFLCGATSGPVMNSCVGRPRNM